jgi:hypothetical protein
VRHTRLHLKAPIEKINLKTKYTPNNMHKKSDSKQGLNFTKNKNRVHIPFKSYENVFVQHYPFKGLYSPPSFF